LVIGKSHKKYILQVVVVVEFVTKTKIANFI